MIWHGNSTEKRPGPGLIKNVKSSEPRKNPEKQRFSVNKIQQKQPCFVKADIAGTTPLIPFYWRPLAGAEIRRKPQKKGGLISL